MRKRSHSSSQSKKPKMPKKSSSICKGSKSSGCVCPYNRKKQGKSKAKKGNSKGKRKPLKPTKKGAKRKRAGSSSSNPAKKIKKTKDLNGCAPKGSKKGKKTKPNSTLTSSLTKKRVKTEEEVGLRESRNKWTSLQHEGPIFAPAYKRLPKSVHFRYNRKKVSLSRNAEEIAGFYSRFIEHEYTKNKTFNENFFKDWRRSMTSEERDLITDIKKCDFRDINKYYKKQSELRKAMSKKEKEKIKKKKEALDKIHGTAIIDNHKEKLCNFRIEPPGLFVGRGDHPKIGMVKRRVLPKDVIINCGEDAPWPRAPKGLWKEVRHDKTVTWLACWMDPLQGKLKYVMLSPTSRLKGKNDWRKYEKAQELSKRIKNIRDNYKKDFKSNKEMHIRQRAVAIYFIDKLGLRAGNEKDEDKADTVGCCSLRCEHIKLIDKKNGKENIVVFHFLGKDAIRYHNEVPVEKPVYDNLKSFLKNKGDGDDLFDSLNTTMLNKHLKGLMNGLTAKVFRTYNASHLFQQKLDELTPARGKMEEKMLAYNRANRAVAIFCNHKRAVPKTHVKSMKNLTKRIKEKKDAIKKVEKELNARKGTKKYMNKNAQLKRLKEQLQKLELDRTDKEEGKSIALGTSKLNYLDPRISVAWCLKNNVPFEKVFNKTQRERFRWATERATHEYRFG